VEALAFAPFAGLHAVQVALLVALYAAAFFIKGLFGYGAVPLLIVGGSFLVTPHHAVVLAAVANLLTHIQYMPDGLRRGQVRPVAWLAVFLVPAIAAGIWVFAWLDGPGLGMLAGAVILGSILIDWLRLLDPLAHFVRANMRVVGPLFGVVSGLIAGIVGAGAVIFVSLYIRILAPDRQGFRATIVLVTGVIVLWRNLVLALRGFIDLTLFLEALLLLPGALLIGLVGRRAAARMSDRWFFAIYRIAIALGAGLMILRGAASG